MSNPGYERGRLECMGGGEGKGYPVRIPTILQGAFLPRNLSIVDIASGEVVETRAAAHE